MSATLAAFLFSTHAGAAAYLAASGGSPPLIALVVAGAAMWLCNVMSEVSA